MREHVLLLDDLLEFFDSLLELRAFDALLPRLEAVAARALRC